jgi:GNAT superfamily N-acetyltransferase
MIRVASIDDLDRLVELGVQFLTMHFIPGGFDRKSLRDSFIEWLSADNHPCRILVHIDDETCVLDAALGYMAAPAYWRRDQLGAKELFWWVAKEARGKGVGKALLKAYADDLDARKIRIAFMTTLADSDASAARLLGRQGWVVSETNYMRMGA